MSDDEVLPTVYGGRWLGDDVSGLPAATQRAAARDDLAAQAEADEAAAAAADRLEGAQLQAQRAGTDTSLTAVLDRGKKYIFRAQDVAFKPRDGDEADLVDTGDAVSRAISRQVETHDELHRWMVEYQARRDYPRAEAVARAKSERQHAADLRRGDQAASTLTSRTEITRSAPEGTILRVY